MTRKTLLTIGPVHDLAATVVCSGVFGAAAAMGHGAQAMLRGAWMMPALFVGGAALSLPPLYLCTTLTGGQSSASRVAVRVLSSVRTVSIALLGLSVPAAYFSATLRTQLSVALLMTAVVLLGGAGVLMALRETLLAEPAPLTQKAGVVWSLLALALGARLMLSLSGSVGG